jgi:O-antigen ligase
MVTTVEPISGLRTEVQGGFGLALTILGIYMFARPLAAMNLPVNFGLISFNEFFALCGSLVLIAASIPQLRINNLTLFIVFYCLYCILNSVAGGKYRDIVRQLLPFVCFFSAYSIIKTEEDLRKVTNFILWGFVITIWLNTLYVFKGHGVGMVLYHTQLSRYQGLFRNIHSMAHIMLLFSFIYYFYYLKSDHWYKYRSKFKDLILFLTLCFSAYCIYKSVTRTTMVGFLCFWLLVLLLHHRKLFIVCMLLISIATALHTDKIRTIFYDVDRALTTKAEYYENLAGGGRIYLWKYNWHYFVKLPLERKLVGIGIGNEGIDGTAREGQIPESHNDFLSALITMGILGLLLYIFLICSLIYVTKRLKIPKQIKSWQFCVIITVCIMNFLSNSYISRFELSQIFWYLMSLPITIHGITEHD